MSTNPAKAPQGQSSSPYINGLIKTNLEQMFKNPDNLMRLQSDLMQEMTEKNIQIEDITEENAEGIEENLEQVMATVVSKIMVQTITKTYTQFMTMHAPKESSTQVKVVIEHQNILPMLIARHVSQYEARPELKEVTEKFLNLLMKKFETTMMMEDDVDMNPSVSVGTMLLLEDGQHYGFQAISKTPSKASIILSELIRTDKTILNSLFAVMAKSMTANFDEQEKISQLVLKSSLINFLEEMKSNKAFAAELDWKMAAEQIESGLATYYIVENGVETKVNHPKDLYAILKEKQFNPEESSSNLQKKLKI